MMMLKLLEGVAALLLVVFVLTEVLLPFAKGTRFFPHFRAATPLQKKVRAIEEDVVEVTELAEANETLREASDRLDSLRPPATPPPPPPQPPPAEPAAAKKATKTKPRREK